MESKKRSSGRRAVRTVLAVMLAILFFVSAGFALREILRERREASAFDDLLAQLEASVQTMPQLQAAPATGEAGPNGVVTQPASGDGDTAEDDAVLDGLVQDEEEFHKYDVLYEQNKDLIGWIEIPGTVINYPVMYTPREPEKYIDKAFDQSPSKSGVPFMDAECYIGCGNYIIYGHHMKSGAMFAGLLKYNKESYWEEHQTVLFDTLDEPGEYQVIAAFYEKVHKVDETGVFRYYNYTDLTDEDTFNEYIEQVKSAAIYDTGVDVSYGDELLTLSTCAYQTDNGRFVVVAKRVK